ncbi:hypothetical protein Tco_1556274 [Tanacetum coccineum]
MHGSGSVSGYANVPTKSTQTATKILQHLEEVDLKEKSSGSTKSPPILTLDIAHSREVTSKGTKKVEDNGPTAEPLQKKCAFQMSVPEDDSFEIGTEKVEDNGPTAEPLQKKCAFQMSVPEDDSFEIDDDDETQVLGESCKQKTALAANIVANIFGKSESKDGKGNDEKAANIFGNLDAPASTALPGTPTNGISTTTTRTLAAIFSTSTPTPVIPSSVPTLVFGFGFATSTTPTISVAKTGNTSVTNDKDLKSNSPFASTPFSTTTTTTGSGLFGSSSLAVTSTTKNQSLASFFNVSNGSQANTQASVAVTPSMPSLFGSGTTSIPSSTSGTSPFSSSAFTIGTSSSFSISSMTASSEGKYGNSTSGLATSIFGSTWDPTKSFGFGSTFNFGAYAKPTPSATTSTMVFGASSTHGSTKYSFGAGAGPPSSFSTPTQNQSPLTLVFGNSTSGPATSIFGSTWDPAKSSRFYNFGVSATPTPSGTTSIPSSTSGTSHFSSSAFTIGTSSSFSISSMTASSEGKYGNSTSGPATSIFGSTWDPAKSSRFYNFGVSATPTPSGTTSIPSSTSGTSPFSSSAFTIGTSSSFSISSMTASSEGKYGNSTSGPATSIFGSTWDPTKSFRFGTTYNFGASATPTPSATTSPVVFGASSTRGSTKYSFGAGAGPPSSFSTPTQNQSPLTPVFGNSTSGPATSIFWSTWDPEKSSGFGTNHMSMDGMEEDSMQTPTPVFDTSVDSMVAEDSHVFGTGATTNNYDDMSMDGMVEDCMQTPTPVPAFGQTSVALPPFTFDSGTQPPFVQLCPHPDWWPAKTNW